MSVAGIDVGKSKLDAHILEGSLERQFNNDKCGRRALRNWLLKHGVTRAVLEPTGRYRRNLHRGLFDAGIETVLVNPLRSRRDAIIQSIPGFGPVYAACLCADMPELGTLLRENRLWQPDPPARALEAAA